MRSMLAPVVRNLPSFSAAKTSFSFASRRRRATFPLPTRSRVIPAPAPAATPRREPAAGVADASAAAARGPTASPFDRDGERCRRTICRADREGDPEQVEGAHDLDEREGEYQREPGIEVAQLLALGREHLYRVVREEEVLRRQEADHGQGDGGERHRAAATPGSEPHAVAREEAYQLGDVLDLVVRQDGDC